MSRVQKDAAFVIGMIVIVIGIGFDVLNPLLIWPALAWWGFWWTSFRKSSG
jgi:hypothetical protein